MKEKQSFKTVEITLDRSDKKQRIRRSLEDLDGTAHVYAFNRFIWNRFAEAVEEGFCDPEAFLKDSWYPVAGHRNANYWLERSMIYVLADYAMNLHQPANDNDTPMIDLMIAGLFGRNHETS